MSSVSSKKAAVKGSAAKGQWICEKTAKADDLDIHRKEQKNKMSDYYDRKEQMEEIFKMIGGREFFCELNAARIPFFFIAAVENTENKTGYFCEAITPGAMGIRLTEDKFADHLNIQNQGFVTVLKSEPIPSDAQGQKAGGRSGSKIGDSTFSTDKGAKTNKNDSLTASELFDAMIKTVVLHKNS